jgi:hypothetical protein
MSGCFFLSCSYRVSALASDSSPISWTTHPGVGFFGSSWVAAETAFFREAVEAAWGTSSLEISMHETSFVFASVNCTGPDLAHCPALRPVTICT